MSPASRSKSKDKKASKETPKASVKSTGSGSATAGIPASAYNPLLGTFHTLDTSAIPSTSPMHSNGRFRNIDETDEHPGSLVVAGVEYDSVSNNGSWSGESEEHKEKTSNPPVKPEVVPGADNDKREKIRQKNERKHQRQKERRAQELRERCRSYLMSRKLETLAQQFVAMGFSHERATMALVLNEGRVEESVAWLFESGDEADGQNDKTTGKGSLKIDISEELARIADMEIRYGCSKQEVERVIVSCEGDLEKAAEILRESKHDPPSAPPKPEETGDPPIINNGKQSGVSGLNPRSQTKPVPSLSQLRIDEKDFNYTKAAITNGVSSESSSKNIQPLKRMLPKSEWVKPQQATILSDKRWPGAGSNPSVSYSLASPLQVAPPPAKTEARYVSVGGDYKNLQPGAAKEPIVVMQRPQTLNAKQVPASSNSSSPPGMSASWYPTNSVEAMRSNVFLPQAPSTRNPSPNYLSTNQMYHQLQYQPQQQFVPGSSSNSVDPQATNRGNSNWNRATGASPTLAAASSLGLFPGKGSAATSGASSPVDWSTGGSMQFDYTSIDWSLDRGLSSPGSNALWLGLSPFTKSRAQTYDSNSNASGGVAQQQTMRSLPSNGSLLSNGSTVPMAGLQDGGAASGETSAAGSREWSSPFEGKDLFSLPRQFVSSPSR